MKKNEKIILRIEGELKNDFQKFCEENDTTMSRAIAKLIKRLIEENKPKQKNY